jgi:hypothetical protein
MRRKLRSRKTAAPLGPSRQRRETDLLTVATFQPNAAATETQQSPPDPTEDAAAEDAVRRMVEAAYT